MSELKIGLIGLDTSHVTAFTKLLNDPSVEYHVPGGRVVVAYPGGSPDFELSIGRVEGFTNELRDNYNVAIVGSPEAVAEQSDVIMLESVDGRVHLEQFRKIAPFGKPTFVDKPFAVTTQDAQAIADLAREHSIPFMSCSSLRYAQALLEALEDNEKGAIFGADTYGPISIQPTQPGLFWYGIHTVDMLYAVLGQGCREVRAITNEEHEFVTGIWQDGRVGSVRGNQKGNYSYGALVHREKGTLLVDVGSRPKPYYASLLEAILKMFATNQLPIEPGEMIEVVRFIEAANESRVTGKVVTL